MAKESKNSRPPSSGGKTAFRIVIKLFILAFLSAYAAAAILTHFPADLSNIKGYGSQGEDSKDLQRRLADAVATRDETIAIEEEEVNAYIASLLEAEQTGFSGKYAEFKGVWVDFSKNRCTVYMERELFGRLSTIGMELKITREGDQYLTQFSSAHYGRMKLPSGFLLLVKHAYTRLAKVFEEEIDLIFKMNQIRFDEDRLVLDPRFP